MESESSLPWSQQPVTGPYTEPIYPLHILVFSFNIHFNIIATSI
jgi:hypothetical protein